MAKKGKGVGKVLQFPMIDRWGVGYHQCLTGCEVSKELWDALIGAQDSVIRGEQSEATMEMHRAIGLLGEYGYKYGYCGDFKGGTELTVTLKLIRNTIQKNWMMSKLKGPLVDALDGVIDIAASWFDYRLKVLMSRGK